MRHAARLVTGGTEILSDRPRSFDPHGHSLPKSGASQGNSNRRAHLAKTRRTRRESHLLVLSTHWHQRQRANSNFWRGRGAQDLHDPSACGIGSQLQYRFDVATEISFFPPRSNWSLQSSPEGCDPNLERNTPRSARGHDTCCSRRDTPFAPRSNAAFRSESSTASPNTNISTGGATRSHEVAAHPSERLTAKRPMTARRSKIQRHCKIRSTIRSRFRRSFATGIARRPELD